jgi:hypothetical protein
MSDDHSPGDARKPYSDIGGPEERHAQTHDVARERHTNPKGPEPEDPTFDEQLRDQTPERIRQDAATQVSPADADKALTEQLSQLTDDELGRLSVVEPGTQLPQGSVFLDLNDLKAGPFKAIGGQEAEKGQKLIAKGETDYELWNRLAGRDDDPTIERPGTEQGG